MSKRLDNKGAIVNISSIAAVRYTGYPYDAYYAAKAAVNDFTMGLALQYAAQNIRVNAIMPGPIKTPLIYQQISGQYADAAAMVATRDAAYIVGVRLPVDGGLSCRAA